MAAMDVLIAATQVECWGGSARRVADHSNGCWVVSAVARALVTGQPDLVVLAPRPWTALPTGAAKLWEGRRKQLPLWKWVVEVWRLQTAGRRLVCLIQPATSQGLQLDFLKDRDRVNRVCISLCAFGRPENSEQAPSVKW